MSPRSQGQATWQPLSATTNSHRVYPVSADDITELHEGGAAHMSPRSQGHADMAATRSCSARKMQ